MERIQLKKPGIDYLHEYFIADMHVHTVYSDGFATVPMLISAVRKNDIAVAVTDHNQITGAMLAMRYKDCSIIPGIEVTSSEGAHILFYFYKKNELEEFYNKHVKKFIYKNIRLRTKVPALRLLEKSKEYNCISSAAHPFSLSLYGGIASMIAKHIMDGSIMKEYDAIEVISGMATNSMNRRAIKLDETLNKPLTAGSDGHVLMAIGSAITYSDASSVEEFLDSIRKRKNYAVGMETRIDKRTIANIEILQKYLRSPARQKYKDIILKRIRAVLVKKQNSKF